MVYADSLNATSAGSFRYSGNTVYPNARADIERSIARVAALPCGILVTAHPDASGLLERQTKGKLADAHACKAYADSGRVRLTKTLSQEAEKH